MREGCPELGDQIARFLDDLALAGRSPATVRTYRHFVRQLEDSHGGLHLAARGILRTYLPVLNSAQIAHSALAAFARWQVDQGYAAESFMARIPFPQGQQRAPKPFLSAGEVRAIYGACGNDSERLMIRLLLTGMRVSELCGVRRADLRGDRLRIRGKGGRERSVVLDQETLGMITPAPECRQGTREFGADPPRGASSATSARILSLSPNTVRWRLQKLGRLTGIPGLTPHSFRRTMASQALLAGMDSRHIRTLGGWESERVFAQRYVAYVLEDAAVEAARALNLTETLLQPQGRDSTPSGR